MRGVARLGEAIAVIPLVKRALPEARLPFQDPTVLAVAAGASLGGALLRRRAARRRRGGRRAALISFMPALFALRGGELAAYHGVEHKAIGAYEADDDDAADATKEHDRCGSHLVAPMLASNLAGTLLLRRAVEKPGPLAGGAVALASTAVAVEVFAWCERNAETPRRALLAAPRLRDPARWSARASRTSASSRSAAPRWPRSCASRALTGHSPGLIELAVADPRLAAAADCGHTRRSMPTHRKPIGPAGTRSENWIITWAPIIFMGLLVLLHLADAEADAADEAAADQARAASSIGWDDVAGADEAKAELAEVVEFLRDPEALRRARRARSRRASCCTARPGTGKTLLAKAVAHESGAQFFSQSAASFVEMFAGLGAARIRRLFAEARKARPAIIFIDELDAVGARRGSDNNSEREQTLNQLLVEMDGFDTTRRPRRHRRVQPAREARPGAAAPGPLRPPGLRLAARRRRPRGDPQGPHAQQAARRRRRPRDARAPDRPASPAPTWPTSATRRRSSPPARAATRSRQADFDDALERVIAGMQSRRALNEHERRVVAWHEAGHALCAELLPGVDRVHKISIVPRGSALGYTLNLPEEDRYLKTREELIDHMTVLLGGRVAEEIVFGAVTTGASDDLQRVAEISRAMIHEYAMGTSITSRKVSAHGGEVSDRTRELRDEEQQHLADEAKRAAATS